ncbi:MAG: peptidylprolyl isomerase [Rhizobiaceae bacterium]
MTVKIQNYLTPLVAAKTAGKTILTAAALALLVTATQPISALAQDSKVLAKVGDREITAGDVDQAATDMAQQFQNFPEVERRARVLDSLIDFNTLAILAEQQGLGENAELKRRLALLRARALHNDYFLKNVQPTVSDDMVKARYDEEMAKLTPEQQVKARHILVKTAAEAEAIIKELEGGADFAELAKQKSTGPSGPKGGDLGTFGKGQMVPAFEAAAFALEKGGFSKAPVQTQFGFHIIMVEDKIDQPLPTLEQAGPQLRQLLLTEAYTKSLKAGREKVGVNLLDESLKLPEVK